MRVSSTGGVSIGSATDAGIGSLLVNKVVSVGGATPATSGSGITFPATQSASSDVNTLDDYEKGTWTPNQGSGLTVVGTFSSVGSYTKVGRMVTVSFAYNATTSLVLAYGGVLSSNLPFQAELVSTYYWGAGTNAASNINTTFQTYSTTVYGTTAIGATTYIYGSITYAATS